MKPRYFPALAAAALLISLTACARETRVEANSASHARPAVGDSNSESGPDSYWTAWRDKHLTTVQPTIGRTYHAAPTGSDDNPGTADRPWRTLQKAAVSLAPGDTLLIADGEYPGVVIHRRSGEAGKPITYRAAHPGKAVLRGDQIGPQYGRGPETAGGRRQEAEGSGKPKSENRNPQWARDAFHVNHASYIRIEGLVVRNATRAGIRVDNAHNVVIRGCRTVQNGVWGIFTNFSDDLLIEYNEAAHSGAQHGIYVSNSADRPVLRFNSCHDNTRAGIQLNGDAKQRKPDLGKRGDGIIEEATIEGNILYNNGSGGASALNLACVHGAKIANNLIFHNLAGGISLFNDHRRDMVEFGSKRNRVLHNTIYFRPNEGRYCLSIKHGSTGNIIRNNILAGGRRGAYEFDDTASFTADHNLIWSADPRSPIASNEQSRANLGFDEWRRTADTASTHAAPEFVNATKPPYDFHLRTPAARAAEETAVMVDLEGKPRGGKRSVGCYE